MLKMGGELDQGDLVEIPTSTAASRWELQHKWKKEITISRDDEQRFEYPKHLITRRLQKQIEFRSARYILIPISFLDVKVNALRTFRSCKIITRSYTIASN